MGNLSFHFNNSDFTCKCENCKGKGEYKIHLGLVGALEIIWEHFKQPILIISGYQCEGSAEGKVSGGKKSLHTMGKAANIRMSGVGLQELFKFAEGIPELKGIGFYPQENFIHVDTRGGERSLWIKEGDKYSPLSSEKRKQYGL